jgi:hypothetical protein
MKKQFLSLIAGLLVFTTLTSFNEDKDPLHKRIFNTSMSETRNGVVSKKVIADLWKFNDGKLQSNFLKKKFGFKYIRYRINKDSVYTDETGTEVRLLEAEATATDESNLTVQITFTALEWDIDGVIRITKNDRLRRYYDMAGREKGGKPKKTRKEKEDNFLPDYRPET